MEEYGQCYTEFILTKKAEYVSQILLKPHPF